MIDIIEKINQLLNIPAVVGVISGLFALAVSLLYQKRGQKLPIAYNVAVVGFPRSGKTILITSLFSQIFTDRFLNKKVILRTKSTIERVNRDIEQLEIGRALGATTDQDLFAYRADIKRGGFLIGKTYKVEIGDFPGEDTEEFSEKPIKWLHETAYFKWVMEADAFVFVIDLAHVLANKNPLEYKANMSKAIRAAWQHLVEYHVEGQKDLRHKPVLLVFSKADLWVRKRSLEHDGEIIEDELEKKIWQFGFGETLPPVIHFNENEMEPMRERIETEYIDIIMYLKSQTSRFSIHFVSHFAKFEDGGRLGISELLKKILP